MTEPMTDAEVKQAIERHKLRVEWLNGAVYVSKRKKLYRVRPTLTDAVAEVVRQIEERAE